MTHRPAHPRPHARAELFTALAALVIIALGCTPSGKIDRNKLASINRGDPIHNLFNDKKKIDEARRQNLAAKQKKQQDDAPTFFTVPANWTIAQYDQETLIYKLTHTQREGASIMLSYDALEEGADRQAKIRQLHEGIKKRLPDTFQKREYREWIDDRDRPHVHTLLKGKVSAEDAEERIVSGYTVAIGQDSYTVFAAYPSSASEALSKDVQTLVASLKPLPDMSETEEEEKEEKEKKEATPDDAAKPTDANASPDKDAPTKEAQAPKDTDTPAPETEKAPDA